MDNDQIKKALDDFEDDKFSDAKDTLKGEISNTRNKYVQDEVGLKSEIEPENNSNDDDSNDDD